MGISTNELRIGNYVTEDGRLILIHDGFGIDHAHNFEAIPITEEWILKFGFEIKEVRDIIEYLLNKAMFMFSIYRKVGYDVFFLSQYSEIDKDIMGTTQIKYVHQLQNLYYSLTQEELALKKTK